MQANTQCTGLADEALAGDKLDVLYGEADVATRARVEEHLAGCPACREELQALQALRRDLGAWQLPRAPLGFAPRGVVVPRWLAAAALLLMAFTSTVSVSGYVTLSRALAAQQARALELEQQQRESARALAAVRSRAPVAAGDAAALLAQLDARVDERLQASEAQQLDRLDRRLADWQERAEVRRRVDMAQVAASLSYLDGRHGEQLARTNELMGYMLEASQKR